MLSQSLVSFRSAFLKLIFHNCCIGFGTKTTQKCSHAGGPRDAREGSGMPSGEGFGKNTKESTFWDPHGGLGAHGCPSGDILASKSSFRAILFSMFFDIYFLLIVWWICHGFVKEFGSDVLCIFELLPFNRFSRIVSFTSVKPMTFMFRGFTFSRFSHSFYTRISTFSWEGFLW